MRSFGVSQRFLGHHRTAQLDAEQSNRVLASGKRVNDFSDDAGAASLASRMNIRTIGLRQATRNIDEAINAATMTDVGMQDVLDLLTRMRELAVQSSNGTLSDPDREQVHKEFSDLREEISRFSLTHNYNDAIRLLANETMMQIGFVIDTSSSMDGEINNLKNGILNGASSFSTLLSNISFNAQFGLSIMSGDTDGARTIVPFSRSADFTSELNNLPSPRAVRGMDPFAAMIQVIGADNSSPSINSPDDSLGFASDGLKHIIMVTDAGREDDLLTSTAVPNDNVDGTFGNAATVGQILSDQGITLHVMGGHGFLGTMANATGGTQQAMAADGSNVTSLMDNIFNDVVANAQANPDGSEPVIIQSGEDAYDSLSTNIAGFTVPSGLGLDTLSIATKSGSEEAIGVLDTAIQSVVEQRATVGASTQQLLTERENIVQEYTTISSASSSIEDADIAEASVEAVNHSMKTDSAIESMRTWFRFRLEQLQNLLK